MSRIVSDIISCENQIHQFFLNQKIGSLLKRSNIDKEKGISPVAVFRVLVTLVFTGKNLYRSLESGGSCGMPKDTVYRFLNSVHTNWSRFLLLLSSRVIGQELEPLTGAANMKVLIADDTLYRRNRSKHVELLSRVFNHTNHRYYRGFRMLIMLALAKRTNKDLRTLGTLFTPAAKNSSRQPSLKHWPSCRCSWSRHCAPPRK